LLVAVGLQVRLAELQPTVSTQAFQLLVIATSAFDRLLVGLQVFRPDRGVDTGLADRYMYMYARDVHGGYWGPFIGLE
jgi:hypothetical protein